MSTLTQVTKGKTQKPDLICLYGPDGIGKSTFAAQAPGPIFLGPESGTSELDVTRLPTPKRFEDCERSVLDLLNETHDYKTLVVDSADWIEPLVFDKICRDAGVDQVEMAYGGYGKWVAASTKIWHKYFSMLAELREKKGMNVIILAHAQVKPFQDPQNNAQYDRYQLKLQDKASAILREFVDSVLFANFETYTKVDDKKKTKAFGDGSRKIYTERRPAYDAKNRFNLPHEIALSWNDYQQAKAAGAIVSPVEVLRQIKDLTAQIPSEELRSKVEETVKKAGDNVTNLNVVLNRLRTMMSA